MQNQKRENSTQGGEVSTMQLILSVANKKLEDRRIEDLKKFFEYADISTATFWLSRLFCEWMETDYAEMTDDRTSMSINVHSIQRLLNDLAESERFVLDDMKFEINEVIKEATTGVESEWLQSMRCKETTQTAN